MEIIPKCPPLGEWEKENGYRWHIYTVEYYSAFKKKKILPYVTTYDEHIDEHGGHYAKWN